MVGRVQIALLSIVIFLAGLIVVKGNVATLNCQVTTNCAATTVFKISSLINAHSEIPSLNNYPYNVCCQTADYSLGTSCETGYNVLKLSDVTNAHVEKNSYNNYPVKACLSSPSIGISCGYTTQNCIDAGYDTCLATISADTNAKTADCVTNPYSTKICCRSECTGTITGTVKNQNNQPVSSAEVSVRKGLTVIKSTTTDSQGVYILTLIKCDIYDLVVSHPDYVTQTKSNVDVSSQQQTIVNFSSEGGGGSALVLGSSCESDCTFAADNIVHASCDGKSGCTFYDSIAKAACDNSQPGWVRDYSSTQYVTCPSGAPQSKIEIEASVSCASGTLVKVTRIVVYNGKPVKLIVATCG
ncbi:MAG: carboxypeptidase-like regulatory domain-containing protein [Nanoarchaeota archaeon]|nr:carboxypeptidase-like regulatory domain-containing protein [Nanoarchaeota archaeon]